MSLNLNKIIISGRITAALELKTTTSGLAVVSFTLAVDRKGAKEKTTDFIPCTAWRGTAEFIAKYFDKGAPICLEGALQSRKYTDKNGESRTAYEVVATDAYFVESKGENATATATAAQSAASVETYTPVANADELPF